MQLRVVVSNAEVRVVSNIHFDDYDLDLLEVAGSKGPVATTRVNR